MNKQTVTVQLDDEVFRRAEAAAARRHMPLQEFLVEQITKIADSAKPDDELTEDGT